MDRPVEAATDFLAALRAVPDLVLDLLRKTIAATEKEFATAYPANLFKNASKCKELAAAVLKPAKESAEEKQLGLLHLFEAD